MGSTTIAGQRVRIAAAVAAFALVAVACGDDSGPGGTSRTTTTPVPTVEVTTAPPPSEPPPTPTIGPDGEASSLDELCRDLADVLASARDDEGDSEANFEQVRSIVASLSAVVVEVDSEDPELGRAVADMLTRSLEGEGGDEGALEAFEILIHEFGAGSCADVIEIAGLEPGVSGADAVLAALAEARSTWAGTGFEDGEYTLTMWAGTEGLEGEGSSDVPPCGAFGEWLVVVSEGAITRAIDKFSGCEIDLDHPSLSDIPATVAAMLDFIEANADSVRVEFMGDTGAPRSIELDRRDGYFSIWVQEIREGHPEGPDEVLSTLAQNRALWEAAMVEDYTITMSRGCFCIREATLPYTVVVRDGEVVSTTRDGVDVELMDFLPRTVEDLFAEIELSAYADSIVVEYDAELGYPTLIDLDPVFNAVDEESTIEVSFLDVG